MANIFFQFFQSQKIQKTSPSTLKIFLNYMKISKILFSLPFMLDFSSPLLSSSLASSESVDPEESSTPPSESSLGDGARFA